MKTVEYKRTTLKKMCRKYTIEYDEEQVYAWHYFVVRGSHKKRDNRACIVDSLPKENLEEYITEQLLKSLACAGVLLKEKEFFEEYVDKIVFRYCTKGEKYKDELIVFIKNKITNFGISPEEWGEFGYLSIMTNYFNIYLEFNDKNEFEYSTLTNSVFEKTCGEKWLINNYEYENGMLIFDKKLRKYVFLVGDAVCQLDTNYISFAINDFDFNPVVDVRYFMNLYFSMLKKKPEIEPVFAVKDTEENLKKIRDLIARSNNTFSVCDYKENHFYIKCLSGEDDELLFRLHF